MGGCKRLCSQEARAEKRGYQQSKVKQGKEHLLRKRECWHALLLVRRVKAHQCEDTRENSVIPIEVSQESWVGWESSVKHNGVSRGWISGWPWTNRRKLEAYTLVIGRLGSLE